MTMRIAHSAKTDHSWRRDDLRSWQHCRNRCGREVAMKIFASAAVFLLVAGSAHTQRVSVRNLTPLGAFEVVNESDGEVSLSPYVQVQRLFNGTWQDAFTDMKLQITGTYETPACVTLHSGERLRPPPWNGFSCASQGVGGCRANVMLPPGVFRFLIASCSGDWRIVGPAFTMK